MELSSITPTGSITATDNSLFSNLPGNSISLLNLRSNGSRLRRSFRVLGHADISYRKMESSVISKEIKMGITICNLLLTDWLISTDKNGEVSVPPPVVNVFEDSLSESVYLKMTETGTLQQRSTSSAEANRNKELPQIDERNSYLVLLFPWIRSIFGVEGRRNVMKIASSVLYKVQRIW